MAVKKYAIIVAGGAGTRMNADIPKQFLLLKDTPVLMHTIEQFYRYSASLHLLVVLPSNQVAFWKKLCTKHNFTLPHKVIAGGSTRTQSVQNGLAVVPENSLVAIHDGVRPLVPANVIRKSFEVAEKTGSAIACVPLIDSIRKIRGANSIAKNRADYRLVQTPQTFNAQRIKEAYAQLPKNKTFNDDATVFESVHGKVTLIEGDYKNVKITTPGDLAIARALVQ